MMLVLIGVIIGIAIGGSITPIFYAAREARWRKAYVALEEKYTDSEEEIADLTEKLFRVTTALDYERRLNA